MEERQEDFEYGIVIFKTVDELPGKNTHYKPGYKPFPLIRACRTKYFFIPWSVKVN